LPPFSQFTVSCHVAPLKRGSGQFGHGSLRELAARCSAAAICLEIHHGSSGVSLSIRSRCQRRFSRWRQQRDSGRCQRIALHLSKPGRRCHHPSPSYQATTVEDLWSFCEMVVALGFPAKTSAARTVRASAAKSSLAVRLLAMMSSFL
jgi:hypothetical protein